MPFVTSSALREPPHLAVGQLRMTLCWSSGSLQICSSLITECFGQHALWGTLSFSGQRNSQSPLRRVSCPQFTSRVPRTSQWTPLQTSQAFMSASRPQSQVLSARAALFILAGASIPYVLSTHCWRTWWSGVMDQALCSYFKTGNLFHVLYPANFQGTSSQAHLFAMSLIWSKKSIWTCCTQSCQSLVLYCFCAPHKLLSLQKNSSCLNITTWKVVIINPLSLSSPHPSLSDTCISHSFPRELDKGNPLPIHMITY